jgi:hypothetical protein
LDRTRILSIFEVIPHFLQPCFLSDIRRHCTSKLCKSTVQKRRWREKLKSFEVGLECTVVTEKKLVLVFTTLW